MIVQHNIMALNSYNRLGNNNNAVQKNLEKLSSGYRINRAGDDAAGLAISEKMRAQITGLERAQLNAKDGISLVQTAEGALTEVHSMLNRLVELGVESANGIYQSSDRQKIQDEVNQITDEIDRISKSTNFNGIKLLDGSLGSSSGSVKAGKDLSNSPAVTDAEQGVYKTGASDKPFTAVPSNLTDGDIINITVNTRMNGTNQSVNLTLEFDSNRYDTGTATTDLNNLNEDIGKLIKNHFSDDYKVEVGANGVGYTFTAKDAGADKGALMSIGIGYTEKTSQKTVTVSTLTATQGTAGTDAYTTITLTAGADSVSKGDSADDIKNKTIEVNGAKFVLAADEDAVKAIHKIDSSIHAFTTVKDIAAAIQNITGINTKVTGSTIDIYTSGGGSGSGGLTLQVADTADDYNKVTISVDDMSSSGLGINGLTVTDQGIAADSITRVKSAIEKVSVNRGRLGALQNRLEHTLNNLATTTENMTSAESRIRDTDMAQEMMAFTKNNVLVQAAQSMLAQANQQPQQVLQLLR